jgi:hypothetical protein
MEKARLFYIILKETGSSATAEKPASFVFYPAL